MISSTDARALLKEKGFDPDDLSKTKNGLYPMSPINYYCSKGNFTMVQYLVFRCGADCRIEDNTLGWFPMLWAASGGYLDICKLLSQDGGAHEDIRKVTRYGRSPLRTALANDHFNVAHWLKRNGALSSPHDAVESSAASAASKEQRRETIIENHDRRGRRLLRQKGFDPDDLHELNDMGDTPMIVFCCWTGNLTMCRLTMVRYLIARGADCRQQDENGGFPLYYAAACGDLEIIKLLYHDGGAHEDIRRVTTDGTSPLRIALAAGHFHVWEWLILKRALSPRNDGVLDETTLRNDLSPTQRMLFGDPSSEPSIVDPNLRFTVLAWAQDAVETHDTIVNVLLTGTIVPTSLFRRHPNNTYATRSNKRMKGSPSPLVVFKGKSGILKVVAEYAGDHTPQELQTLRQLSRRLSAFIDDVPFVPP